MSFVFSPRYDHAARHHAGSKAHLTAHVRAVRPPGRVWDVYTDNHASDSLKQFYEFINDGLFTLALALLLGGCRPAMPLPLPFPAYSPVAQLCPVSKGQSLMLCLSPVARFEQ